MQKRIDFKAHLIRFSMNRIEQGTRRIARIWQDPRALLDYFFEAIVIRVSFAWLATTSIIPRSMFYFVHREHRVLFRFFFFLFCFEKISARNYDKHIQGRTTHTETYKNDEILICVLNVFLKHSRRAILSDWLDSTRCYVVLGPFFVVVVDDVCFGVSVMVLSYARARANGQLYLHVSVWTCIGRTALPFFLDFKTYRSYLK